MEPFDQSLVRPRAGKIPVRCRTVAWDIRIAVWRVGATPVLGMAKGKNFALAGAKLPPPASPADASSTAQLNAPVIAGRAKDKPRVAVDGSTIPHSRFLSRPPHVELFPSG